MFEWQNPEVIVNPHKYGKDKPFLDASETESTTVLEATGQLQWKSFPGRYPVDIKNRRRVAGVRWGSGVLISKSHFLTAGHCVATMRVADKGWVTPYRNDLTAQLTPPKFVSLMKINFNYQNSAPDADDAHNREKPFEIEELVEHGYEKEKKLDYAILKLKGEPGEKYGFVNLSFVRLTYRYHLTITQHPEGAPKKHDTGYFNQYEQEGRFSYKAINTLGGSSGSSVAISDCEVVGVHVSGNKQRKKNYAISIVDIYDASGFLCILYPTPTWGRYAGYVASEMIEGAKDSLVGSYNTIRHPIDTVQGLGFVFTNPGTSVKAIANEVYQRPWKMCANLATGYLTSLAFTKLLQTATTFLRNASQTADAAAKAAAEAQRVAEAAQKAAEAANQAAQAVDAANKAALVAEATLKASQAAEAAAKAAQLAEVAKTTLQTAEDVKKMVDTAVLNGKNFRYRINEKLIEHLAGQELGLSAKIAAANEAAQAAVQAQQIAIQAQQAADLASRAAIMANLTPAVTVADSTRQAALVAEAAMKAKQAAETSANAARLAEIAEKASQSAKIAALGVQGVQNGVAVVINDDEEENVEIVALGHENFQISKYIFISEHEVLSLPTVKNNKSIMFQPLNNNNNNNPSSSDEEEHGNDDEEEYVHDMEERYNIFFNTF